MTNMKSLSLPVQKLRPRLKGFFCHRVTDTVNESQMPVGLKMDFQDIYDMLLRRVAKNIHKQH